MSDLYQVLEVEKTATEEEIKKAFHKQALRFHPDKAGIGQDAKDAFELAQKAHEILIDPKTRAIYDKYGMRGIEALNGMGEFSPFLDPNVLPAANRIFTILSAAICLLVATPTLMALKIDQQYVSYIIAFSPLFTLDLILYLAIILAIFIDVVRFEGDSKWVLFQGVSFKFSALIYFGLLGIFQLFLALKLDRIVDFHSWQIISPFLAWEGLNFLMILVPTVIQCFEPTYEEGNSEPRGHTTLEIIGIVSYNYYFFALRLAQTILIVNKIYTANDTNWVLIFLPLWILGGIELFRVLFSFLLELPQGVRGTQVTIFVLWAAFLFTTVGLLVTRLNSSSSLPSVLTILIPFFIIMGLLFLCTCCCLPCLMRAEKEGFDQEMAGNNTIVAVDHRIELPAP